jgi:hypothetical protein
MLQTSKDGRTSTAQPPAIAHPIRCSSQFRFPELQKLDWSTAVKLSEGQLDAIRSSGGRKYVSPTE